MKRWIGLVLALLLGLYPLSAAATKPTESPVPEIGMTPLDGRHFDSCNVDTDVHIDGTVSRSIEFINQHERELAMRTLYGSGFEDQLRRRVAPLGGQFEYSLFSSPSGDLLSESLSFYATYRFYIDQATPEQALAFTNAVLQTEHNEFALTLAPHPDWIGCVTVSLAECFDLANCMDEDALIASDLNLDVSSWYKDSPDTSSGSVTINWYQLHSGESTVTETTLIAPFEQVILTAGADSEEMGEVSLDFTPLRYASPLYQEVALTGLRQAAEGKAAIREKTNGITLTFSGTPEGISRDLNGFVNAYVPERGIAPGLRCYYRLLMHGGGTAVRWDGSDSPIIIDIDPLSSSSVADLLDLEIKEVSFTLSPLETADRFKTALLGSLTLDLRPVVGSTVLILRGGEGVEVIPEEVVQYAPGLYGDALLNLRFVRTQTSLAPLPLILVGALLLLAGIGLFIWRFKDIRPLFARPAPAAPAAPVEQPAEPEEEPITFEIPEIVIAGGEEEEP